MPLGGAVVAGAATVGGGLIGAMEAKKSRQQAMEMARQAAAQYNGIIPPAIRNLIVQEFQSQGTYTPEIEQAIDIGESEVAGVQEDAGLKSAQLEALNIMRQRSTGGISPEDRAALNQVRAEVQRDAEAKRQQIAMDMQARGLGGSGSELAMQLQAAQESADRASAEGDRIGAMASQNALQALANYSDQANTLQGQGLDLATTKASAADEFNRFNIQGRRDANTRNVSGRNDAQQVNLGEKQRLHETNITNERDEQLRIEAAKQAEFDNKMGLASAKANALSGMANMYSKEGQAKADMWSGIGKGVGTAVGEYSQLKYGQKKTK
jgi:hypothetical protein